MLSHPMTRFRRALLIATLFAVSAGGAAACGEQGISVPEDEAQTAALFAERCSGCHTLNVVGTEGSTTNIRTREYKDGPNFNQRHVSKNCALYAIRNGGFSSGPMPQNIVTGEDAVRIAEFLEKYSKKQVVGESQAAQDCPPAG